MKCLFAQSGPDFSQFKVFKMIFDVHGQNFHKFFLLRLYLLLYSKRPSWTHGFNAKIGLKIDPAWAEIFKKKQNWFVVWFGMPCWNTFLQISQPRVVRFSNRFLRWNRVFKTVILSTIKGRNGVKKIMKILSMDVKNHLKNPKLRENWTWLGKKAFHLGISDP